MSFQVACPCAIRGDCEFASDQNAVLVASRVAYSMLYTEAFEGPAQFAHQSGGQAASIRFSSQQEFKRRVSHSIILCLMTQDSTTFSTIDFTAGIISFHRKKSAMGTRWQPMPTVFFAKPTPHSTRCKQARPTAFWLANLGHDVTSEWLN